MPWVPTSVGRDRKKKASLLVTGKGKGRRGGWVSTRQGVIIRLYCKVSRIGEECGRLTRVPRVLA